MNLFFGNKYLVNIAIFILSGLLGWFGHSFWYSNAGDLNKPTVVQQSVPTVLDSATHQVARTPLLADTQSDAPRPAYQANPASIMEYLRERSAGQIDQAMTVHSYQPMMDKELRDLIHQTPGLAANLLEELVDLEQGATKTNLSNLLLGLQLVKRVGLDNVVLDKIKQGERRSDWLDVLGELGISSAEGSKYMNEQLTLLIEPQEILSAIKAISGPSANPFLSIEPATRASITKNLYSYIESPYDDIRSAAVFALQNYPIENLEQALLEANKDRSFKVRETARLVFVNKASSSQALKEQALESLQNASLELDERLSLSHLLGLINLSPSEKVRVDESKAQLKAIYDSFDDREIKEYQEQVTKRRSREI